MKLLDRLFRTEKAPEVRDASLASPDAMLREIFGVAVANSGATVTPRNAMRCTPVRCAVNSIAETLGTLPLIVYQRGADGARERATEHPTYAVLHDAANDWTPAAMMVEQVTRDALLFGNGYAFINRNDGRVVELIRIDPERIKVDPDTTTGEPIYRLTGTGARVLDRRDLIHIKAPGFDGITGASPVTEAREAIGLALVMEQHGAKLFGNGARPSGILTFPNRLGDDGLRNVSTSWNAAHAGGENGGRTAIIEEGGGFTPLTFSSVDAQFQELRRFAIEEIARVFRVPPHMLYELGRATWSNAAEMGQSFLTFSLKRWIKAWEGEVLLKLYTPDERATYTAEFLVDDLLRADIAARSAAYTALIGARVLNPNECRAMENRPPYAGGDAFANPAIDPVPASGGAGNV